MRRTALLVVHLICTGLIVETSSSQDAIESLGLENQNVTSVSVNYGILAVGTDRRGVYWQTEYMPAVTGWTQAGLDTLTVRSVYAHKSGPLGWAISAGVDPGRKGDPFIYCSYVGGAFEARSFGISDSLTTSIVDIDGFPDPTICGETYAAGGRALYRRYFIDTTWTPVYVTTHEGNIRTVTAREEYPGVVFAGGSEGFSGFMLVRSSDYGETWSNVSPPTMVEAVDFGGTDAALIFAAGSSSVFRSRDGGQTWDPVWSGHGAYQVSDIAFDPGTGHVYVAGRAAAPDTTGLLIVSADEGTSWRHVPLKTGPVVGLALSGDWVVFGTAQDGLFRFRKSVVDVEDEASWGEPMLAKNYPNPFDTATTISYDLSRTTSVVLTVFDLLGRQIRVMEKTAMPAGRYKVEFDATGLPSGVYVYRLDAGDYTNVGSMIVRK